MIVVRGVNAFIYLAVGGMRVDDFRYATYSYQNSSGDRVISRQRRMDFMCWLPDLVQLHVLHLFDESNSDMSVPSAGAL